MHTIHSGEFNSNAATITPPQSRPQVGDTAETLMAKIVAAQASAVMPQKMLPVPMNSTAWAAATVSGAGTVNVNATNFGHVMSVTTAANTIFVRQYAGLSTSYNWLPGTNAAVDFTKPFRLCFAANFKMGGALAKFTLVAGGLTAAPTVHALADKGFALTVQGTGAGTGTIACSLHNGTVETASSAVAVACDGTLVNVELKWVPAVGLYLLVNGAIVASVTTNLPTGTVAKNGWAMLLEHTASSSYSSQTNIYPMTVFNL